MTRYSEELSEVYVRIGIDHMSCVLKMQSVLKGITLWRGWIRQFYHEK